MVGRAEGGVAVRCPGDGGVVGATGARYSSLMPHGSDGVAHWRHRAGLGSLRYDSRRLGQVPFAHFRSSEPLRQHGGGGSSSSVSSRNCR